MRRRSLRIEDRGGGGIYHARVVFIGSGVVAQKMVIPNTGPEVWVPEWASIFRINRTNYETVFGTLTDSPFTLVKMVPSLTTTPPWFRYAPRPR